jgi:tryptophan-rich sensory protein
MAEYIPIFVPSLLGYGTAMFFKLGNQAGENVSFRPPAIVFSIVWPILYILLGLSWYFSRQKKTLLSDIFYISLIIFLSMWIVVYSNNKKNAIYILLLSIVFALLSYTVADLKGKLLITPLIVWLIFATILNIFEVQNA